MQTRTYFRAALCSACLLGTNLPIPVCDAQELKSLLQNDANSPQKLDTLSLQRVPSLEFGEPNEPVAIKANSAATQLTLAAKSTGTVSEKPIELATEKIRERFKDGKVHIERNVALDRSGNYVNHGDYEEWNQNGDVVCTGSFQMGQRHGPWIRFYQSKEAKLFGTQPYARFKAPFQSSVEFENGKMNGVWVIVDADRRVVSQIQLHEGTRNGQSAWFYPNGQLMFQADYANGVLNGVFIEKTPEGKVVREESYVDGQRTEIVKEQYANKAPKSETHYLTAAQRVLAQDDWENVTLATYSTEGEHLKHGPYVVYYENGQVKLRGAHERGVASGLFESWHANGEKAVAGWYENGAQHGKWSWWHPNGMRQSIATYDQGKVADEVLAWNEQGKRVEAENVADTPIREGKTRTAQRITPASAPLVR